MKCAWCKRGESVFVKDKESHGICPACLDRMIVEDMERARTRPYRVAKIKKNHRLVACADGNRSLYLWSTGTMKNTITDEQYEEAARRIHGIEGTVEIDKGARISRGQGEGAYVQAWVWVYDNEVKQ